MNRSAFTLIELLVVIAIIAVLAIVVIIVLNPAQLTMQARDSDRLQDLATISQAIGYYAEDTATNGTAASLGSASTSYISVPDPSATSTAGDQCQGLSMPSLGSSTWQCAASSTYRSVNGAGWIPVALSNISVSSPISQLPQDPTNQTSTGLFYSYSTNGSQYEITATMESSKYKSQLTQGQQIPGYPEVAAQGTSFSISPLYNPNGLVGYWPFEEGSGSSTADASGNGNGGTWNGNSINGSHYSGGKVGSYAGNFNGSNDWVSATSSAPLTLTSFTLSAWFNCSVAPSGQGYIFVSRNAANNANADLDITTSTGVLEAVTFNGSVHAFSSGVNVCDGAWHFAVLTRNGSAISLYLDQALKTSGSDTGFGVATDQIQIGANSAAHFFIGFIDDVRVYSRALSAAEIAALYDAEK